MICVISRYFDRMSNEAKNEIHAPRMFKVR